MQIRRLVWAFAVCKQQSQDFSRWSSYAVEAQTSWPSPGYAPDYCAGFMTLCTQTLVLGQLSLFMRMCCNSKSYWRPLGALKLSICTILFKASLLVQTYTVLNQIYGQLSSGARCLNFGTRFFYLLLYIVCEQRVLCIDCTLLITYAIRTNLFLYLMSQFMRFCFLSQRRNTGLRPFVLFVLMLYLSVTSLVMLGRIPVFLDLTITKQRIKRLAQGHNTMTLTSLELAIL